MSVRHPERTSETLRWLSLAAASFLAIVITVAGAKSYKDLTASRVHESELRQRVETTRQQIEALQREVERLSDDPATLERVAREELGLVAPDDLVVVLPPVSLRDDSSPDPPSD